jgi:hypothetical protein
MYEHVGSASETGVKRELNKTMLASNSWLGLQQELTSQQVSSLAV